MGVLFADLQTNTRRRCTARTTLTSSQTHYMLQATIVVDIAMACQSDSEYREILDEFDDDNK